MTASAEDEPGWEGWERGCGGGGGEGEGAAGLGEMGCGVSLSGTPACCAPMRRVLITASTVTVGTTFSRFMAAERQPTTNYDILCPRDCLYRGTDRSVGGSSTRSAQKVPCSRFRGSRDSPSEICPRDSQAVEQAVRTGGRVSGLV